MLELNPWRNLVGKPYSYPCRPPDSFDCYSLVVWVRDYCFGVRTPLLIDPSFICEENLPVLLELHRERHIYLRVDKPEPSDIVIFSANHIGVVVSGGVLSAMDKGGHQVVFLDWRKMNRFFSKAYAVRYAAC